MAPHCDEQFAIWPFPLICVTSHHPRPHRQRPHRRPHSNNNKNNDDKEQQQQQQQQPLSGIAVSPANPAHWLMFPWPDGCSPLDATRGSSMPFSPGWFAPLSTPTVVLPESEATGFSPGAVPLVCPGALSAPRPWAVRG